MKSEGTCLLVDNSNTRTKFALSGTSGAEIRVLATADISEDNVQQLLEGWAFERVCLCSVVPSAADALRRIFADFPVMNLTHVHATDIDFSLYPGLATLGADRIANVLAACQHAPLPLVAVDLGTASTLDVLCQSQGRASFIGGMIAPGMASVASSMHAHTAQLPDLGNLFHGPVIGRNTREAMAAAVRVGYPGMRDSLLDAIEKELGEEIHVILTGGDASSVAAALRRKCIIVPHLTLQGIALAAGVTF